MTLNKKRGLLFGLLCVLAPFASGNEYVIEAADLAIVDSEISVLVTLPAGEKQNDVRLIFAGNSYLPGAFSNGQLNFPTVAIPSSPDYA